jgi:phenylacetate-CoA ligase
VPTEMPVASLASELAKSNNPTLYCFPSVLKLLAQEYPPQNIKRIISTGELLSEKTRNFAQEKLGCKVYNHYGTMEFNRIAWECGQGMHMDIDSLAIEFVKNDKHSAENDSGSIVISNLNNMAFPLIRYEQGDIGAFSDERCGCGRGLPLIGNLHGRNNDFIKTENGSISPVYLDVAVGEINGVRQYRVVQEAIGRFSVYIVKQDNANETEIEAGLRRAFESQLKWKDIQVKFVSEISRENGGKLRTIVSVADK